jgi:hypothetical protein
MENGSQTAPLTAASEQQTAQPARKIIGRPWVKGQSGNPLGIKTPRRITDLFEALAAEYGGVADLSVTDRALIMQAARLFVRSERVKKDADAVKCANAARRMLIGLRKRHEQDGSSDAWSPLRHHRAEATP